MHKCIQKVTEIVPIENNGGKATGASSPIKAPYSSKIDILVSKKGFIN